MLSSFVNSRMLRAASLLLVVGLAVFACKKEKPHKKGDGAPASVWARATTDDRVLHWRKRCGTDARAQRNGANINLSFKSGDGVWNLGCTLEYREANRDLLSVAIIVASTDPKATAYGQWAKLETEVRELVDDLLPEPARAKLWDALASKTAGNYSLGNGLDAQIIEGNRDGILTVVLNVHMVARS
jgi:hypothetical protein